MIQVIVMAIANTATFLDMMHHVVPQGTVYVIICNMTQRYKDMAYTFSDWGGQK